MGACGFERLAGSRIIPALQELKDVHPAPLRRGVLFRAPDNDLEVQTRAAMDGIKQTLPLIVLARDSGQTGSNTSKPAPGPVWPHRMRKSAPRSSACVLAGA